LFLIAGVFCAGFLFVSNTYAKETTPVEECKILLEIPESTLYFSNVNPESNLNFAILQDNKVQFKLISENIKTSFFDEEESITRVLPFTEIFFNKTDFRYFIKRE